MIVDDIAFSLETNIDNQTRNHLISCFGSTQAIYCASEEELIVKAELNEKLAKRLVTKSMHPKALEQLRYINKHKISFLSPWSEDYPSLLNFCGDPAYGLYAMGDTSCLKGELLTMVGTRHITSYGQRVANKLIGELSEMFPNLVIVSGLAYGIDAECHRAAIHHGLKTVAVVKDVLPEVSPVGNHLLASSIISSGGCILSETTLFSPKFKAEYIKRNRILAAMSSGTVVVEALEKGGANSTANRAHGYDRVVMAVPGRIEDKSSVGTNNMIASQLAHMVYSGADIAEAMGWVSESSVTQSEQTVIELTANQRKIMDVIPVAAVVYPDFIAQQTELEMGDILAELFELESLGLLNSLPGGRYERK